MRDAVRAGFMGFSAKFESVVPFPYLDVKNLVTIAVGNMLPSPATMCALPLLHADGTVASREDMLAEWANVTSRTDLAKLGGWHFAPPVTKLHLSPAEITRLVLWKLDANERILAARFQDWDSWCADAQLGTHSLAWADGPYFKFPKFEAAAKARDWATCSIQCHLDETGNHGLVGRNIANRLLFENAQAVADMGADPAVLYYPGQPTISLETAGSDPPPSGPAAA